MKKWKNKITTFFKELRKNPKEVIYKMGQGLKNYAQNNVLFLTYLLTTIVNAWLLRLITMGSSGNVLSLKPVFADLSMLLLLGAFGYLFKPKKRFPYYMVLEIFFTAICLINSIYYTFYTSFASISMLSLAQFIGPVGDAVVQNVLHVKDLVYLLGPVLLLFVHRNLKKRGYYQESESKEKRKRRTFKTLIASGVCAVLFAVNLTGLDIGRFTKQWNREYVVMQFGIYTYQINDLVTSVQPKLNAMFGLDEARKTFYDYFEGVSDTPDTTNQYTGVLKGKNVIAIHAESIQDFVIGMRFNGVEVTPTLNRLVKEGMHFTNFYSQVSVGTSSDTEFTLSTSLMPAHSGTAFVSYFDRTYISLQNLLKEQNYYIYSMHGNTADFWNRRLMYQTLGYDRFFSKKDFEITKENSIGLGISDKSFFAQAIPKMEEIAAQDRPWYGTFIMLTNHTPFSEVDKYDPFDVDIKEEITNENGEIETVVHPYMEGTKLGNYFKSVHYADAALGEFLAALDEKGLLENTVVMIYGDHDARLPKSDYVRLYNYDIETDSVKDKKDPEYIPVDSYQYELNRKVPLIFWDKKGTLQGEVDTVMGMIDILPTLGNMMGLYNKYQLGHDIFQHLDDNIVVFPYGNWMTNKVYYDSQKSEYLSLKGDPISEEYIASCNEYAEKLLDVSDKIIVFDLLRVIQEEQAVAEGGK